MAYLSITSAWNETTAFVKREGKLLFPVAFALLALPAIVFQYFAPEQNPAQPPEAGPWMWLLIPFIVLTIWGTLTLTTLALRPGTVVAEALASAGRRLPVAIGAALLLAIGGALLFVPIQLAFLATASRGVLIVGVCALAVAVVVVGVRMAMLNPVAAAEPGGPIMLIRRSWTLTSGHFWKLLGFLVLALVLIIVLSIAVTAIGGILAALIGGAIGDTGVTKLLILLLGGLLNAILSVYLVVTMARIYAQLAGEPSAPAAN